MTKIAASEQFVRQLIFWQNAPSIHQAPMIKRLTIDHGMPVCVVTETGLTASRKDQGWGEFDYGNADIYIGPSPQDRQSLVDANSNNDSFHLFSGFNAYPQTCATLKRVGATNARIAIVAEAADPRGLIASRMRKLKYRYQVARWSKRIDLLLAMGKLGTEYYRRCGFPAVKLHEFGYFVSSSEPAVGEVLDQPASDSLRILFVGRQTERKNAKLLLHSLAKLRSPQWTACLVGDGPLFKELVTLAGDLGISRRTEFISRLSNQQVCEQMSKADVLVLPSLYDGWGAVVNEGLLAGARVICSRQCGASSLIRAAQHGSVFDVHQDNALTEALVRQAEMGKTPPSLRVAISEWAQTTASDSAGASYLHALLCSSGRVSPPWRNRQATSFR